MGDQRKLARGRILLSFQQFIRVSFYIVQLCASSEVNILCKNINDRCRDLGFNLLGANVMFLMLNARNEERTEINIMEC